MESTDAKVIPYHKSNRGRTVKDAPKKSSPPRKVPSPRKVAAGRKAFQGDYCEIHYGDNAVFDSEGNVIDPGKGCAKFSHLDTTGLGVWRPPFYRTVLAILTKAIKPLFIVGFFVASLYGFLHFAGGALHFGGQLPKPAHSSVPGNVRHAPANSVSNCRVITPNTIASCHPRPTATKSVGGK